MSDPYAMPADPIAYWRDLRFTVRWAAPRFGEPLTLYVAHDDLGISFCGEGRDAGEVYEDAWRYYVAYHIDATMAWAAAARLVEPFGLRVVK